MIDVILHTGPNGPFTETRVEDLSEVITQDQTVLWVDVVDPTPEEIRRIGEEFVVPSPRPGRRRSAAGNDRRSTSTTAINSSSFTD